ncbi:hypothetical protein HX137_06660 [Pseudomonas sp. 165]|uniref:hypothetical protein n=1 Tax=Pseudomonas TaxID=286 RepID=UPI00137516E7|nr:MULTISPECIES: hypothetical protein [Pseudomonas]MCE1084427.1 hypothetical protein [Pseudomonas asiatica]MDM1710315.1 hypothetical protein [Pseudomonas sp. 165]
MTDKPLDHQAKPMTSIRGHRQAGFGAKFTAVVTAVGVGIDAMTDKGNGLSVGGVTGTVLAGVGAYLVTDAIDASVGEGVVIGALAGGLGSLTASTIDNHLATESASEGVSRLEDFSLLFPVSSIK